MTEPDYVTEARKAVDAANQRLKEAMLAEDDAKKVLWSAKEELNAAMLRADEKLHRVKVVYGTRTTETLVIHKRTEKQIVARRPGDNYEFRFRKSTSGRWEQYPKVPHYRWANPGSYLLFDEGAK